MDGRGTRTRVKNINFGSSLKSLNGVYRCVRHVEILKMDYSWAKNGLRMTFESSKHRTSPRRPSGPIHHNQDPSPREQREAECWGPVHHKPGPVRKPFGGADLLTKLRRFRDLLGAYKYMFLARTRAIFMPLNLSLFHILLLGVLGGNPSKFPSYFRAVLFTFPVVSLVDSSSSLMFEPVISGLLFNSLFISRMRSSFDMVA